MLLLLDLNDGTVLEGPAGNISLAADALDEVGRLEGGVKVGEFRELDEVPDFGEGSLDDAALENRGGGGNCRVGSHGDVLCVNWW